MTTFINSTQVLVKDAYDYYLWTLSLSGKSFYYIIIQNAFEIIAISKFSFWRSFF